MEKTEQPTAKRRKDERKKGNVFKSQDITLLLGLLAVVYTIQFMAGFIWGAISDSFDIFWDMAARNTSLAGGDMPSLFVQGLIPFAICALPPLVMAGLVAIVTTIAQTRGLFNMSSLKPKFSKLNPISGIKKMFSLRGVMELLKSLLKIIILSYVIYSKYVERFPEIPRLMEMELVQVMPYIADFVMDIISNVTVFFVVLAAADFMYQRWQYEKDLRMSKQEIKEEYKQTEGDPQVKGKIKQKQREMSMGRMMQNVPDSDVIIRNPTHYAVALRYQAGKNISPMVTAKGADYVALRIIKKAEESGVPIVENRPLARGLYEGVPLEREIPESFFQPVAEVLAFVYSKNKKKAHETTRAAPRQDDANRV